MSQTVTPTPDTELATRRRVIRGAGIAMFVLGALVLIGGFVLIQSLTADLRATVTVTGAAVETIEETVTIAADLADGATDAMASASNAAADAAEATQSASVGMTELAAFLEVELAENVEAIRQAIPGAIGAASAIDSTLGALSFFGLDYSPQEPFADSLRRIQTALDELPDGIREQSEVLADLGPAAGDIASGVATLADDMDELTVTLSQMDALSEQYESTVAEAEAAVAETADSLDRTVFLLRVIVVLAAIAAVVVGVALRSVDRIIALLTDQLYPAQPEFVVVGRRAAAPPTGG